MKPASAQTNTRLRPNRVLSHPPVGITMAEVTMYEVMTQEIWSCVAEKVPCMCGRATAPMLQSIEYRNAPSITDAVLSAGCRGRLRRRRGCAHCSLRAKRRSRLQEARQVAFVDQALDPARQAAAAADVHRHRHGHARAQLRLPGGLIDADAHGNALHHLHPVAGGVLRRQHGELRSGRGRDGGHHRRPLVFRIRVGDHAGRLTLAHVGELRLLEVGLDPHFPAA